MKHFSFFIIVLVLFSTSSQATWVKLDSKTTTNLYTVRFVNASVGYASGAAGIVVKTTDGGTNWTVLNNIALVAQAPPDLYALFPASATSVYTAGTNATIARTEDGGTTWSYQPGLYEEQRSMFFVDRDTGYSVGYAEVVVKTTDRGAHWINEIAGQRVKKSDGGKVHITIDNGSKVDWLYTVSFTTKTKGFAAGSKGDVYGTVDGGAHWLTKFNVPNKPLRSLYFPSQNIGYVVGESGFIAKTSDGGESWESLPSGSTAALYGVHFLNDTVGYVVGAQGLILKTTNGGGAWRTETSDAGADLLSIHFPTPDVGYAVGNTGTVIKWSATSSADDAPGSATAGLDIVGQYPNPAHSSVELMLQSSADETITLRIVDALGRERFVRNEELRPGANSLHISTERFPTGVYSYMISSQEKILRGRFIVE